MKRLTFKKEHEGPVKAGMKTGTARWRDQKFEVGDVVSAVVGKDGKPAFLTPASEGFAHLRITKAEAMAWRDFGDEQCAKTGARKEWYLREKPAVGDLDLIYFYEFELVEE